MLFFFVPELLTYIWQVELISWTHEHTLTDLLAIQRWVYSKLKEMFISGVIWFNIALGVLFLLWVWRSK